MRRLCPRRQRGAASRRRLHQSRPCCRAVASVRQFDWADCDRGWCSMKPGRFSYEAPDTIDAALASLAAHGDDAKIIAGGQSLAPMLNMRLARPEHLIDINGLGELSQVRLDGDRLMIGAMVRHAALGKNELIRRHCPMLAYAAK